MKKNYEQPLSEVFEMRLEGALLTNSAEAMKTVTGSWDDEEW